MRPWMFLPGLALLIGAGDAWVDAASQDLHGYARSVSLDLRGVVPTAAELQAIEDAGTLEESLIDEWMGTTEFEEVVIGHHRDRFWNELEINLLNRRRLVNRDGVLTSITRSRYTRGAVQTECGVFEATVDELNRPLSWETNDDDSRSEGYVMVAPYWDPENPVEVCAYDAQLVEVSASGVDCTSEDAHFEPDCGCGPNLQWCIVTAVENEMEAAMSADLNERVRHMLGSGEGYGSLFDGDTMFVNGPSAHFFRHIGPFSPNDYQSPVPIESLPDIDPNDANFHPVALADHHDGVLTAPGWLLRHQTNRGRANRFYGAFLCSDFIPPEVGISGLAATVVPSPDLQMRDGCLGCHARLEPWSAYWGRWAEAATRYWSPEEIPAYSEECATCAISGIGCSDFCEDYYVVETVHADQLPYIGWALPYAFLADDKATHPDLGPLGWVDKTVDSGQFGQCAVEKASDWLLNSNAAEADLDAWAEAFTADDDYRAMVKRIVMSPSYWGGAR